MQKDLRGFIVGIPVKYQRRLDSYHVIFSTNEIALFWHCLRQAFLHKNLHTALKYSNFEYFYLNLVIYLQGILVEESF